MYLFRMRHLLFTLLGLITLLSLLAMGWGGRLAWRELNEARHLLLVNDVAELTLRLNTNSAMERGVTTAMLAQPAKMSDAMRVEMLRLRRENEAQVIELLAVIEASLEHDPAPQQHHALEVLRRERQSVLRARGIADVMLQRGEHGGEADFLAAINAYIEAVARVRSMSLTRASRDNLTWRDHLPFKEALYIASEYAGRERAMLGVAIAQARTLSTSERDALVGMRHTTQVALGQLELTLNTYADIPDVVAAHDAMNAEFRQRYLLLRDRVTAAAERDARYPVDVETWYREATRGINSIIDLGTAVNAIVSQRATLRVRQERDAVAVFVLAAAVMLTLSLVAALIIRSRIILPLRQLEVAAAAIGRGDYAQSLQLRRGDELGELGTALDTMRTNLLEQLRERDRIEALLRGSAQRFRNLVESTNDWLWELDSAGRYSYVSPQVKNILGYEPEEVLGRSPFDFMPEDEAARLESVFAGMVAQRAPIRGMENINRHKTGRLVVLETNGVPVLGEHGEFKGYRGIDRDITERREAEQAQHESERRFRDLLENMQLMSVMLDDAGNIMFINDFLLRSTGRTRDEVLGRSWFDMFIPEDIRSALRAAHLRAMAGGIPASHHEHEIIAANGDRRRIVWNTILIYGPDGRATGSASVGADVTEQRRSEAEMHKLLRVVEQTDDAVMITDPNGVIEYVNTAFERVTGYGREEVIGTDSRLLYSEYQDEEFYRRMWGTIASGRPFQALMTNRRKSGELLHEEKTITPLRDTDGVITHYVATSKDVTERRRMDEQLQQSEKLASIGQLAAGVAHEINNPVGYISSNIATLARYIDDMFRLLDAYEQAEGELPAGQVRDQLQVLKTEVDLAYVRSDIRALLDESGEGVARVKKIVQDLKDFSRQEDAEWQLVDLHKGLESTLNIVHNEIKYKAEVVRQYGDLPLLECMPSQLNQVFMNLLVNAAHAIDEHGVIHVRTGVEKDWVWAEVEDDGKGISAEHLNRIFEPFFTTKPVGKGTGLGLSISYGIVQKHGGRIDVESQLGKGSRFRVWLPVRQPVGARAAQGEQV